MKGQDKVESDEFELNYYVYSQLSLIRIII